MLSNEFDNDLAFDSQILEAGEYFEGPHDHPEALPIHVTSAHNVEDLDALLKRYKDKNGASSFACLVRKYGKGDKEFREDILRDLFFDRIKVSDRVWIKLGKALEAEGM